MKILMQKWDHDDNDAHFGAENGENFPPGLIYFTTTSFFISYNFQSNLLGIGARVLFCLGKRNKSYFSRGFITPFHVEMLYAVCMLMMIIIILKTSSFMLDD